MARVVLALLLSIIIAGCATGVFRTEGVSGYRLAMGYGGSRVGVPSPDGTHDHLGAHPFAVCVTLQKVPYGLPIYAPQNCVTSARDLAWHVGCRALSIGIMRGAKQPQPNRACSAIWQR